MIKSMYVHIPFCNNICNYCDFCKMYYDRLLSVQYIMSLAKEIQTNYQGETLKTIYIGGGTPSILQDKDLTILFNCLDKIKLTDHYEFTFECNIEDIDESLLKYLKQHRINRLSIGVQSFNNKILTILGRNTDINVKEKVMLAKKYFTNINLDFIYGLKEETLQDLEQDLKNFLDLDVTHISTYSLILEEHTKLKVDNYEEIDDDINRKMYDLIRKILQNKGFKQYEISNFSKPGYESKHNLVYWNNEKYYGFGLGASGYINNCRYTNTRNINKYLKGEYIYQKEDIDTITNMENEMILGLRKTKGVSKRKFYKKFHHEISDIFDTRNLNENKNYFYISKKNLFISNYILSDFVDINM